MQEEVEQRIVSLMISCGKLGEQEFRKAVAKLLEQLKNGHQKHQYSKANPHGKMTVKQLAAKDKGSGLAWATRCCCASACSKPAALPSPCSMHINGGDTMLTLTPVTLATANAFVNAHHRHHKATAGHKFSIGCAKDGELVGVAIVGRPVSRYLDDGWTLEVNRLCTTGEKNACSILYAASARAAKAMRSASITALKREKTASAISPHGQRARS